MRFVVMKGTAGFGDRLQCLLQVIGYAKATGRHLVIDWRDQEWSDNGFGNFGDFFGLEGMVSFDCYSFLQLYANQPRLETVPSPWQIHMQDPNLKSFVYKKIFMTTEHGKMFAEITDLNAADFSEDVVVYAGTGFRKFAYSNFNHIAPNPWLSKMLKAFSEQQGLKRGEYDVVHLRAGSKAWAGGHVPLKAYAEKMEKHFPDKASYFKALDEAYKLKTKADSGKEVFVLSDSKDVAHEWIAHSGVGKFIDHQLSDKIYGSGLHCASDEELKQVGSSKFESNLDMLRDFAIMLNARHVIHDGHSQFSRMAEKCGAAAHMGWHF